MKKTFKFNYDSYEGEAKFQVDTDVFTDEHAKATLEFFTWDYDELENPVHEVMRKYAMEAIKAASRYSYNLRGVISHFNDLEGFCKVDGSKGITLLQVDGYEFDDDKLEMEVYP